MSDDSIPLSVPPHATGSTESAGQSIDEGKGRVFPCEGCGADLKFHIGQQRLQCPYCGFEKEIELAADAQVTEQDFHGMLTRLRELREQSRQTSADRQNTEGQHAERQNEEGQHAEGQNEVRCDACGATVVFVGPLTSSECPYCASPIQRDKVHDAEDRVPVDGVLPFMVDKDRARHNLGEWVRSRWFAPNEFLQRGVDGKFSGVYLPYWTFDSLTLSRYSGERGDHYYVTVGTGKNQRSERRTRWSSAAGQFQRFFDDVLVLAATDLRGDLTLKLEPWPLGQCASFNQQMLAGYLARTYEVELDQGFVEARQRIDAAIRQEVHQRIGGDVQRIHAVKTHYDALTFKHLLLPTWLLAYRYNQKVYQVMVNAASGEVQGERPYSWVKILLAVLAGLAAAGTIAAIAALR